MFFTYVSEKSEDDNSLYLIITEVLGLGNCAKRRENINKIG